MRKLLNTLYITNPDMMLSRDGENIVIKMDGKEIGRRPVHILEKIVCFHYIGMNAALMRLCAKHNVSVCFLSPHGEFAGFLHGETNGNVLLRREQYRIADSEERSLELAKTLIAAKVVNSKKILQRTIRDYSEDINLPLLEQAVDLLTAVAKEAVHAVHADQLRGKEGEAAKIYFGAFNEMIRQQKEYFYFTERTRRPPRDGINALMSFAYSMLAFEMKSALETVGLDPYVGFFHKDRPGRESLALDLMEELRGYYADRFVLSIINRKQITAKDFVIKESGGVLN